MAIDKPLYLFSDSTALRLLYATNTTQWVSFVVTSVGGVTVTPATSAQTWSFASGTHVSAETYKRTGITQSTAASTALSTRGIVYVASTSTGSGDQHLYTITDPTSGEELKVMVDSAAASSFTFKFNSSSDATFGDLPGTTDLTQISFPGLVGSYFELYGASTARWLVGANVNCTISSSTS